MRILGLDPGLARTGFGLIDTNCPTPFERCGCLTTAAGLPEADRLAELGDSLIALLTEAHPDLAAVESVYFGKNTKTAISTAQTRGVILYLLRRRAIPVIAFTPLQVKSRLTGFGRADKRQVQHLVQTRLKLVQAPTPDDAADALACALCAWDYSPAHSYASSLA